MWEPPAQLKQHRREGLHLISKALECEEEDPHGQHKKEPGLIRALYKMGIHELDLAVRVMDFSDSPEEPDKYSRDDADDETKAKFRKELLIGRQKAKERLQLLAQSSLPSYKDISKPRKNSYSKEKPWEVSYLGSKSHEDSTAKFGGKSWEASLRTYSQPKPFANSSSSLPPSNRCSNSQQPNKEWAFPSPRRPKPLRSQKSLERKSELESLLQDFDEELQMFGEDLVSHLKSCIVTSKLGIGFDDVIGLDKAKQSLKESVILPALRPEIFSGLRAPSQGLLLFGPPGNGKTLIAKALAKETSSVMFNITASILTSKFVGEGEKLMRALFSMARKKAPSIIFIDEIDSILSSRKSSDHEASRRMKTEFFAAFDGLQSSKSDRILVIGATNRPEELDSAAIRRFTTRIYITMPDIESRFAHIGKLLSEHGNPLTEAEMRQVAKATSGYSGSDLTNLARDAAFGPIRDIPTDLLVSIQPDQIRKIRLEDFRAALTRVRVSVSSEALQKFTDWNKRFGDVS